MRGPLTGYVTSECHTGMFATCGFSSEPIVTFILCLVYFWFLHNLGSLRTISSRACQGPYAVCFHFVKVYSNFWSGRGAGQHDGNADRYLNVRWNLSVGPSQQSTQFTQIRCNPFRSSSIYLKTWYVHFVCETLYLQSFTYLVYPFYASTLLQSTVQQGRK